MNSAFASLLVLTFREPREAMRRVLSLQLETSTLWYALLLVAIINVLLSKLFEGLVPLDAAGGASPLPSAPFALVTVIWLAIVIVIACIHFIGQAFGGTGSFDDALRAGVWLQTVLDVLQIGQMALFLISPVFAILSSYVIMGVALWLMVNFVATVHGFQSNLHVLVGMIVSAFGVSFALSLLAGFLSLFLGVDIVNG